MGWLRSPTDARCASVKAVLDQLLCDRTQVNDNLARLYLVDLERGESERQLTASVSKAVGTDRAGLDGLDGRHRLRLNGGRPLSQQGLEDIDPDCSGFSRSSLCRTTVGGWQKLSRAFGRHIGNKSQSARIGPTIRLPMPLTSRKRNTRLVASLLT